MTLSGLMELFEVYEKQKLESREIWPSGCLEQSGMRRLCNMLCMCRLTVLMLKDCFLGSVFFMGNYVISTENKKSIRLQYVILSTMNPTSEVDTNSCMLCYCIHIGLLFIIKQPQH